jgi:DNA-binding transcriptional MocR family regulator
MGKPAQNLPQKLADDILAYIVSKHMQPGEKLPNETILSEKLNAGRSSVREAMKLLVSRNIIEVRQGSGTYISSRMGMSDDPLGLVLLVITQNSFMTYFKFAFLLNRLLPQWQPVTQPQATYGKFIGFAKKRKRNSEPVKISRKQISVFTKLLQEAVIIWSLRGLPQSLTAPSRVRRKWLGTNLLKMHS